MVSSTEGVGDVVWVGSEPEDGDEDVDVDEDEDVDVDVGVAGHKNATQGLTPNSVFAKFSGSSQRCSTRKPGGSFASEVGRPISSKASLRAVSKGCSSRVSALPPGRATWPA